MVYIKKPCHPNSLSYLTELILPSQWNWIYEKLENDSDEGMGTHRAGLSAWDSLRSPTWGINRSIIALQWNSEKGLQCLFRLTSSSGLGLGCQQTHGTDFIQCTFPAGRLTSRGMKLSGNESPQARGSSAKGPLQSSHAGPPTPFWGEAPSPWSPVPPWLPV